MKWDYETRREYRKLYYKVIMTKRYDISDYNRFMYLSGDKFYKNHKIALQDIPKPEIFKIEHKKVIIDFN